MRECSNYQQLKNNLVQCRSCCHYCRVKPNCTGICGVRHNKAGKLYLLVDQQTISCQVDPVEKKPLFHFLPGSLTYSFGTLGCNFRCANCQNYDISQMFDLKGQIDQYEKLALGLIKTPQEIVAEAQHAGCQSIAYTYNEPTIFWENALEVMKLAREKGLKNIWVSNGFMSPETLEAIIPYLDAINIDIKSWSEDFYQTNCGARLAPILENCQRLVQAGVWLEITTLIIPTLSDQMDNLKQIAQFTKEKLGDTVPWHLSAFSGTISWKLKYLPATSDQTIRLAYQLAKQIGLKHVYVGNVRLTDMENTYCHQCGELIIKRQGYQIERHDHLGSCPACQQKIIGIFN